MSLNNIGNVPYKILDVYQNTVCFNQDFKDFCESKLAFYFEPGCINKYNADDLFFFLNNVCGAKHGYYNSVTGNFITDIYCSGWLNDYFVTGIIGMYLVYESEHFYQTEPYTYRRYKCFDSLPENIRIVYLSDEKITDYLISASYFDKVKS